MQNIFIVPAMQHGCRAKPLYLLKGEFAFKVTLRLFKWSLNSQDTKVPFVPLRLECKGDLNELKPSIGFRWCM